MATQNFEALTLGDLNGQANWVADASWDVVNSNAHAGSQCIGNAAGGDLNAEITFDSTSDGSISFWAKTTAGTGVGLAFNLYDGATLVMQTSDTGGNMVVYFGGSWSTFLTPSANTYYKIDIEWRSSDHTFRIRSNGGTWVGWNSQGASWTGITKLQFNSRSYSGSTTYIDDVIYPPRALTDYLVHYWKLDETGTGNASDSVGSLTMVNTDSVTYTTGKINNGVPLSAGSSQSMITGASGINFNSGNSWSVSVWAQLNNVADGYRGIISNRFPGSPATWWTLGTDANGYITCEGVALQELFKPANQGWQHYVITHIGGTPNYYLYRNGSQEASYTGGEQNNGDGTRYIKLGNWFSTGQFWDGMIDEVGIWTISLTTTEITALYNSGNGLQYPFSNPQSYSWSTSQVATLTDGKNFGIGITITENHN